jgi:flavin-dependent dehydrogenase
MYDAIVVGARCAGSPTAMLLAQKGYRVLLVDKATFPSDTMSTLFLQPAAMARLIRWGLLERVRRSNCPSITKCNATIAGVTLTGFAWSAEGITESFAPRRTVLDKILVDAAVEAGAELREGFSVDGVLTDGDAVTGILGHSRYGGAII